MIFNNISALSYKIIDKEIFYEYNGAGRKRKGVGGLLLNV
jgi:hypothetical protein